MFGGAHMSIRSKLSGILDETDLFMLEAVLAKLDHDTDEVREYQAMQLLQFYQAGITDPDELLQRIRSSELK
jgi:hypothetical protein